MATDVTQQTNYLKRFRESLESATISMATPTDRLFVMQIALKCADLGNPCRPWVLSKKWTAQICDEFYRQGDYEKQLNMQVTPIFDRRTASVARIQIGKSIFLIIIITFSSFPFPVLLITLYHPKSLSQIFKISFNRNRRRKIYIHYNR